MTASWTKRGTVLNRLGRQHFAFYRGYLDGLDLRDLAQRYVSGSETEPGKAVDLRLAKSLLAWIIGQLETAARRNGQQSAARLLHMPPASAGMPARDAAIPALAEFQLERDPHQMYSERELLELYEQEYGGATEHAARKAKRIIRLRARHEALLQGIETQMRMEPRIDDPVTDWIDHVLASRLADAGIKTLGALMETIEAYGFRWYARVPRIGIKAAAHITGWLLLPSTAAALGSSLSVRAIKPRSEIEPDMLAAPRRQTGIVPLEYFLPPDGMDGRSGNNLGARPAINAMTDIEAIECWLASKSPCGHTVRVYRKEAERFLLWSVLERGTPLTALTPADRAGYAEFLGDLGRQGPEEWLQRRRIAQHRWLGPRGTDRWSSRWRPFEGPLSAASQKAAIVIVCGLMRYLCKKGYLACNPFSPGRPGK